MPAGQLNDRYVKGLKHIEGGDNDYWDEHHHGLFIRVGKQKKSWGIRYRKPFTGKQARPTIGEFLNDGTGMNLADARAVAERFRQLLDQDIDPMAEKEAARAAAEQAVIEAEEAKAKIVTVGKAVARWLEIKLPDCKNDAARYQYRYPYDSVIVPGFGADTPLTEITYHDIDRVVMSKGETRMANRVFSAIKVFFDWASKGRGVRIVEGGPEVRLLDNNPAAMCEEPYKETYDAEEDARVLNGAELKFLIPHIQRTRDIDAEIKIILQVLAFTGRRPKEICGIEVANIHRIDRSDEPEDYIFFPKTLMKGTKDKAKSFVLPLNAGVNELIGCAIHEWRRNAEMTGIPSKYLFRTHYRNKRGDLPVTSAAVTRAMKRMIDNLVVEGPDAAVIRGLKENRPTPYCFRSTVTTIMSKLKVSAEARKAVLAHRRADVMNTHYDGTTAHDRAEDQIRPSLAAWEKHLLGLLSGEIGTGVIELRPTNKVA